MALTDFTASAEQARKTSLAAYIQTAPTAAYIGGRIVAPRAW
jgi:hypothetical protein